MYYYAIPREVKLMMENPDLGLESFDSMMHPGGDTEFLMHKLSMGAVDRLLKHGIKTFIDLEREFKLVQDKKSNLPASVRVIIQGHYTYYMNMYEVDKKVWDSLTEDQRDDADAIGYIELDSPKFEQDET